MSPSPQAAFASALRNPSSSTVIAAARFAIYRGNRIAALTEALAATYPATRRIVGEDFFDAMARAYIAAHPPASPVLHEYGGTFAEFASTFEPAADLPYLADVARVEWAWMCAYHAEDVAPLRTDALTGLRDEDVLGLRFTLHPSIALICSVHPAGTIWRMNADGNTPGAIEDWRGENALVLRPDLDVTVRIVPDETASFLAALDCGLPLGLAAEASLERHEDFDLAAQLAGAFALGLIAGISPSAFQETDR